MANSYDDEITVALTANATQMQEGIAQATASINGMQDTVAREAAAFNAAVQSKVDAMVRLNAAFATNVGTTAGMAEAEAALDQAMAAGALSTGEYAGYVARLDAAESAMAETVVVSTAALEGNTAAMVINGGVARELGVLMGELARGNYTRLEGSSITLANRTGLLAKAFSPLGGVIGLTAATVGVLAAGFIKGAEESEAFNKALLNTGGILGVTEAQFNSMISSVSTYGVTQGKAREALQDVANTGRFTGDMLLKAGQAAADFAELTGMKMEQAVRAITSLADKPSKALEKLNEEYHFLKASELEHIEQLEREGNTVQATKEAIDLFGKAQHDRMKEATDDAGLVEHAWVRVKNAVSDAWETIKGIGRTKTFNDQIKEIDTQIASLKEAAKGYIAANGTWQQGASNASQIAQLEAAKQFLQLQEGAAEYSAKAKQELQQQQDQTIKLHDAQERVNQSLKNQSNLQEHVNEAVGRLQELHKLNGNDDALKGFNFDADGKLIQSGEMWASELKKIQKEYGETAKRGESMHKQLTDQLTEAESADKVSFDKRKEYELQFWTGKLSTLKQGSLEYAQAYRQVQTLQHEIDQKRIEDAKRAAKEELKAKLEAINQLKDEYDGEAEVQKQRYQNQFDAGQINARRLADLEKDLVARKLAADIAYLQAKKDLDEAAGESGAEAARKEAVAIINAKQKAALEMARIDGKEINDSIKDWKRYGDQVAGAFKSTMNGMLFQGETWKKGMANIAMTSAEDFIQTAVKKPLDEWVAGNAAKLANAVATMLGISTADDAQKTADDKAEALKTASSIARASAVAGANGIASFAGAPWPIDLGAPGFGSEMALAAMSYGSVTAAAGGWERVPHDDAPALLHRNEMVLPAHIANPLRDMVSGGGARVGAQGGGGNITIQATDARSVSELFRRDLGAAAKMMKYAARMGHMHNVKL